MSGAGRPRLAALTALLALGLALAGAAQAQESVVTLVANTGQDTDLNTDFGLNYDWANAFTTGGNAAGYMLTSVKIPFQAARPAQVGFSVSIQSSLTAGTPGAGLGALTLSGTLTANADNTFTASGGGIALAANTTYFLVIDVTDDDVDTKISITEATDEDTGGAAGWSIADDLNWRNWNSTGSWGFETEAVKFSVQGYEKTATAPPAPPPDTTPPRVRGEPVVTGDTLTLDFTERLHAGSVPPASAFEIRVGDAAPVHPTAVVLSGRTVTLTLALATSIAYGDTVEVRYTRPATGARLRDGAGNAVRTFTRPVTNATPAGQPVADAGADRAVDPGTAVTLDGSASIDPDGETLSFAWRQVAGAAVRLAGPDRAQPSFTAAGPAGPLTFRLTVTDPDGLRAVDTVTVTVRDAAPHFDAAPAALALSLTRTTDVVLPAAAGGNGALSYRLTSDPAGLAGLTFDPATRTLAGTPTADGSYTFTYRAEDADENRAETDAAVLTFAVTVADTTPARKRFLTRTLAVMGAQTLGNALDTLGARFTDADPASSLTVGGQHLTFGDAGARTTPSPQPSPTRGEGVGGRDETARRAPQAPSPSLGRLLSSSRFTLALGPDGSAGAGIPRWTLWGRGGGGAFAGQPEAGSHFKGQTRTGWLGLDARGGDWVAGLALSYDRTEADYRFHGGTAPHDRGDLETTLTTLYPYGRWALSETLDVQTILGAGRGTARHRLATGAPPEKSDLSLWLGSVGLRQQLPPVAGITLAARADASLVQLETDAGVQAIDGLTARSWRGRLGLDAARPVALEDGTALAPFVSLVGRYDGGDGFVGAGLEVAGGLRYTAARFELEARGRWLAVHAQDGAQERGLSVTARLSPDMNGEGLSLALAPRWGAATGDATALWQHDLRQSPGRPGPETAALDAQLGYGVALADGVLTPFAGTGLAEGQTRTYRVGTRWQMTGRRFTGLTLNLEGTRQESAGPQPVNQGVQLQVGWTF